MPIDPEIWTQTLNDLLVVFLTWLPRLAGALALLFIGWIVARLVQFLLTSMLRRLGLDRLAERSGASAILSDSGLDPSAAALLARLIYWLVLLVFVLAAAESLSLPGVADTFAGLLAYIPNVIAAALILLLGGLVSRVAGDTVGALARQAGVGAGPLVGQVVRYVLLIFVGILALDQLGVETGMLTAVAIALIASLALAMAVAFGFGSRDLARNIMAGFHAKDEFVVGQSVRVRGHEGRLVRIGSVKSILETDDGQISLPNLALAEEEVVVLGEPDSST